MLRVQTIQIGSSAGSSWWCVRHSVCSRLHYVHLKILFEHLVKVVLSCCLYLLVVNYAFYYALLTLLWSIPRVCAATLKVLILFHLLSRAPSFFCSFSSFRSPGSSWCADLVPSQCPRGPPTQSWRELSNSLQSKRTTSFCLFLSQK